ncbi:carboxylesterase/lipase family protein [Pedomonas mirosovicensis]|uniref:carboxylesterase/lipase family protein n=1 Tax=Pedomonas mirosovicensis TaxID=2908641 RepID=UPI00216A376E|nr:carboxylesterase/lipase family protein [Pedomonas mirosovicensis]MCH8686269.1 carboxylesterase/lipase family protein [Pedomonas mirosovicensis]
MADMRLTRRAMIGAGLSLAAAPALARADAAAPVVATQYGRVRGLRENGINVFKGIRYGADTRTTRFQAPQPPQPWSDIKDATRYGPACPQGRIDEETSEDCLFLNVWSPGLDAAKRPVMVYIHGGAYASGSGSHPLTDGARLAANGDVVVVTINHRLNAFGYAYLARLSPRFADSGNAGMLDIIMALKWVRDNIAAFGGDPGRVMLFGQSGGGAKIATLMGMEAAKGLFHRGATMSGQQVTASGPLNATARAKAWMAALGVPDAEPERLLDLPAEKLVEGLSADDPVLNGRVYFGPVLDEKWLTRHPFWPDANPLSAHIPMILGNTLDETRGFVRGADDPRFSLTWEELPQLLASGLVVDILPEHVVAEYRRMFPNYSPSDVYFAATTAGRSWRGQVIEAEMRNAVPAPTWVYQLNYRSPVDGGRWGAFHSLDIGLVFGTLTAKGSRTGTGPEARATSAAMQKAFVAFARDGDPNRAGGIEWPTYRLPQRATMIFDANPHVQNDPRGDERRLFAKVPYVQPGT